MGATMLRSRGCRLSIPKPKCQELRPLDNERDPAFECSAFDQAQVLRAGGGEDVVRLLVEQAREDRVAARREVLADAGHEFDERAGQDVGEDQVVGRAFADVKKKFFLHFVRNVKKEQL